MGKINIESVWNVLRFSVAKVFRLKGHGISILVPLHLDDPKSRRAENWKWLEQYWKHALPGAEVIIGSDDGTKTGLPFSKSIAVNNAASHALGDIFVIADADAYISAESVLYCAKEIREAEKKGYALWFMPYRKLYRLTREASDKVLISSPKNPYTFPSPPMKRYYFNKTEFEGTPVSQIAHWYGAMMQIVSRKAFELVGGWDIRMRGWGSEDHAAKAAMDTLYSPYKTLPSAIFHLWHPDLHVKGSSDTKGKRRLWANQQDAGSNDALSWRYYGSIGNRDRMRKLVDEFKNIKSIPTPQKQRPTPPDMSS